MSVPPGMPGYFELLCQLQADAKRVRQESRRHWGASKHRGLRDTAGVPNPPGEGGQDEHHIAIGSAGPSLAEESNTSW